METYYPVPKFTFEVEALPIASALKLENEDTIDLFKDGRVSAFLCQRYAEKLFLVNRVNRNGELSGEAMDADRNNVKIRVLTARGVKFQKSRNTGCDRECTPAELISQINETDKWLIFDVSRFPIFFVYQLEKELVRRWFYQGELLSKDATEVKGLTWKEFTRLVKTQRVYTDPDDVVIRVDLKKPRSWAERNQPKP